MAIPVLVTTRDSEEIVWAHDPDVAPSAPEARGWIRRSEASVSDGADVILVRGLTGTEKFRVELTDHLAEKTYAACKLAVQGFRRGKEWVTKRKDVEAWVDTLPSGPAFDLYTWVLAVTNGVDPQAAYRAVYEAEQAVLAGESQESQPAPKSDG